MPDLLSTRVETRRFVFPGSTNARGTAHGGSVLKWMEQTAAMSAMRFAGADVATVGLDRVRFHAPIPEGSIALLEAYVYGSGTTSVDVWVRGFDEDRHTGRREAATEAAVTLVAVADDGETVPVPELTVETETGRELAAAAPDRE